MTTNWEWRITGPGTPEYLPHSGFVTTVFHAYDGRSRAACQPAISVPRSIRPYATGDPQCPACVWKTHRCTKHTWTLVRRYHATESFYVASITRSDTGNQQSAETVQPGQSWSFDVVLQDQAIDDDVEGTDEEWLACRYCAAEIRGDRIGEIT